MAQSDRNAQQPRDGSAEWEGTDAAGRCLHTSRGTESTDGAFRHSGVILSRKQHVHDLPECEQGPGWGWAWQVCTKQGIGAARVGRGCTFGGGGRGWEGPITDSISPGTLWIRHPAGVSETVGGREGSCIEGLRVEHKLAYDHACCSSAWPSYSKAVLTLSLARRGDAQCHLNLASLRARANTPSCVLHKIADHCHTSLFDVSSRMLLSQTGLASAACLLVVSPHTHCFDEACSYQRGRLIVQTDRGRQAGWQAGRQTERQSSLERKGSSGMTMLQLQRSFCRA